MITDATKRFSSRVENYVKYRPGYPTAMLDFLARECQFTPASVVADIGSGTGKLTELFLKHDNTVFGVEPNQEMRVAAENLLADYPRFHSVAATAEATTLPDSSQNFIIAGQAFHWFDRESTRREFLRILASEGWVALIWNDRQVASSPFLKEYEDLLLTYAAEYRAVNHRNIDLTVIGAFFGERGFQTASFPNAQTFDFEGLKGRLLSSSYAPEAGQPNHLPMLAALRKMFDKYQQSGTVVLACDTLIYYGQLQP